MTSTIRVLLVDDHAIVREGLQMLLAEEADIEVVGEAPNGKVALALVADLRPDVVLMDLVMPEMDGLEAMQHLRELSPASHILVLTTFTDDQRVHAAIRAGATGYLLKDVLKPELVRAIRDASQGKPTLHPEAQQRLMQHIVEPLEPSRLEALTERERGVLRLIAQGKSNKEISAALHLTEGTIKGYVSAILSKLEVADRTQAALYAVKHGLQ